MRLANADKSLAILVSMEILLNDSIVALDVMTPGLSNGQHNEPQIPEPINVKPTPIRNKVVENDSSLGTSVSTEVNHGGCPQFSYATNPKWRLFPVKQRDKKPLIKDWPKLATSDKETLLGWATKYPNCNWGLATGPDSGIFVLDADSDAALEELNKLGKRPTTYTVKTSRGWHFYFIYPSNSTIRSSAKQLADGLDVRGKGGYVLLPSSVHPSGAVYRVLDDALVAQPPAWLLAKIVERGHATGTNSNSDDKNSRNNKATIPDGARNATLASLAGSMQHRGMAQQAIEVALLAENEACCKPPLTADEVRKIVCSITRYEPASSDQTDVGKLILGSQPIDQLAFTAEQILKDMREERMFRTPNTPRLVRIIQYRQARQDVEVQRDPEANIMVEVDGNYLLLALSRSKKVFKYFKEQLVWADSPRKLADMILSSVCTSPEMTTWNRLRMLSRAPILLPDGRIEKRPGYNELSEIWLDTQGAGFEDQTERDAKMTAEQARRLLEEQVYSPFERYQFAKEESGQQWYDTPSFAVVLSAMFSTAARNLLPTVPIVCIDAPEMGSGKTKLAAAISVGMTGTKPSAVSYDGAEEFSKHLPPLLEQGDRLILVDNVNVDIACDRLAIALTQDGTYSYRPLGLSQSRKVENRAVLIFTGNNLSLSGDLPRRSIIARIIPDVARPEYRKFSFDPVERAQGMFPKMVMAVLSVIRAHMLAGFPGLKLKTTGAMEAGSFPEWNRFVRAALLWMGYSDPLRTQKSIRNTDPERAAHEELLVLLRQTIGERMFSAPD